MDDTMDTWTSKLEGGAMPNGPQDTHFWTTDENGEHLPKPAYFVEGVPFYAYGTGDGDPGRQAVYRFYNATSKRHFWTTDANGEKLDPNSWVKELVAFYVPAAPGPSTIDVYRFSGDPHHFWTTDPNGELLPKSFSREGVVFQALASPVTPDAISIYRFYSRFGLDDVGRILQQGTGFKEVVIGAGWQWINTYINISVNAVMGGADNRPVEIATGFIFPWNNVGPNHQSAQGPMNVSMGPVGSLYARSMDGAPLAFGYRDVTVGVTWATSGIKF